MKPRRGALAICGIGTLGLIMTKDPVLVEYPDGNSGMAWSGIHLTSKVCEIGTPWSSRNPVVVGYVEDIPTLLDALDCVLLDG